MKRRPPTLRPTAFTLVELLVVITIIALLAALSFAGYHRMQVSGRAAACASNLRGIGAAFGMYTAENDGLLPAMRYRNDPPGENPSGKNWQFELNPYLQVNGGFFKSISTQSSGASRQIFCPEYVLEYKGSKDAQKLVSGGYGMNPNLGGSKNAWDARTPMASIPSTSRTIIVGDSDDYHLNVNASTWPVEPQPGQRFQSGDPLRHGRVANYLHLDGHVEALSPEDAQALLSQAQTN